MTSPVTPALFYRADDTAGWHIVPLPAAARPAGALPAGATPPLQAEAVFETGSFAAGSAFVAEVAQLADAANHHPDVSLTYPRVTVRLTTHDAGSAVTTLDLSLAQQISRAAAAAGIAAQRTRPAIGPKHEDALAAGLRCTLATLHSDGRPQLSTVAYTYADGLLRVSLTDSRVKVRNLRRDPRATVHVTGADGFSWIAADGIVTLSEATTDPQDATADELVDVYRAISGEHPDWDEFRAAMVADDRLVMRMTVLKTYGV